ncbi:MAG TPA: ABC transporter permease [Longimicrobiales bacterium]
MGARRKPSIRDRYARLVGRDIVREVDEELAFHLECRTAELIARGVAPERAREQALRRFGDVATPRAECIGIGRRRERRMIRAEYLSELRHDVVFTLRALRKRPGFALVAVLTLALGIGANSAIFSVVNGVLLASLPYEAPAELVRIRTAYPNGKAYPLSAPDFASLREEAGVFEDVVAYSPSMLTLTGRGEPRQVRALAVSDGFFRLLGVAPVVGRAFHVEEHRPGGGGVVILDHGFWQREFAGDPAVLGRTLILGGDPFVIVGVLPRGFSDPGRSELYVPIVHDETFSATTARARRSEWLGVVARMKPGITPEEADAAVRAVGSRLQQAFPQTNGPLTFSATPLREMLVGQVQTPLLVLLGAVGLVLLIACANVANLLLSRAAARETELAVRAALGAGRRRIIRQLLTESAVLGLLGGVAGLLLAYGGTRALVAARPEGIPRLDEVGIDGVVVAFTFAISLLTAGLFGVVPALQATAGSVVGALREGGRGALGARSGNRLRGGLIIAEVALAVLLLVGAGLLIRSFLHLTAVDPGFRPAHAMAVRLSLQGRAYAEPDARRNFFNALIERLEALPGVLAVGGADRLPMQRGANMFGLDIEGRPPAPEGEVREIRAVRVTPGYFEAIGVPLRRGRMITPRDRGDAVPVLLINEATVERWFPGEDPLGQRILLAAPSEIVGVVGNVRQVELGREAEPEIYIPYAQRPGGALQIVVRTAGDPLELAAAVRREVHALDPNLPVEGFTRLEQVIAGSVARPRFYTTLLGIFAAVALALAAVGIFGVMSYAVAQRRREIGIRLALGARPAEVVGSVVARGLALAGAGIAVGTLAALGLTRVMRSQLYGVSATDPLTFAAMILCLGAAAALASWLPARRAARVDPMVALRDD